MNCTNNKRTVAGWYWYREHHYGPGWLMALMAKHTRRLLKVRPWTSTTRSIVLYARRIRVGLCHYISCGLAASAYFAADVLRPQ